MKRKLFNALAVVSAVLCVATVGLWVRSYFYTEGLRVTMYWTVATSHGEFLAATTDPWFNLMPSGYTRTQAGHLSAEWIALGARRTWDLLIAYGLELPNFRLVVARLWVVCLIFSLLPFVRIAKILQVSRWMATGRCRVCGYDLRATPDRCPECGTVPKKAAAAS